MEGAGLAPGMEKRFSQKILDTAQNLAVDLVTAEIVGALREREVRSILLKGPSFASLLYRDGDLRSYVDVDLLIASGEASRAHGVLVGLGFAVGYESRAGGPSPERVLWVRSSDEVDVHFTLQGVRTEERHLWSVLSAKTERQDVGGLEVEVLSEPGRAMHVALHAAQHGGYWDRPLDDLRRAVELLPFETWESAAGTAEVLRATTYFAAGLRLVPEGEGLAERLGLASSPSVEALLRAQSAPDLTLGFEKLYSLPGAGAKARFLVSKLFPPRANMEFIMPLARRGRLGLAASYFVRLGWVARRAGAGFRAWIRARREVGGR
jgi:hypothetical protein